MAYSTPERLPCGCYRRCGCRKLAYTGFAVTAILALLAVPFLGVLLGALGGGGLGLREVLHVGAVICLCTLVVTVVGAGMAAGVAAITERRHSAREIWAIAKMSLGMAAGSVAGSGAGCLLLLVGSTRQADPKPACSPRGMLTAQAVQHLARL